MRRYSSPTATTAASFVKTRIIGTAVPVIYLSNLPGFTLRWVWLLSAVTIFAQLTISLLLLRREFRRRLVFVAADSPASAAAS